MEYKILESPGTEIDHIDGAIFNNFSAMGQDGIIPEVRDECSVIQPTSNQVSVMPGELLIHGFRVKILSSFDFSFTSSAASSIAYHIVARITLMTDKSVLFEIDCREVQALQKDDLYHTGSGIYEIELATFEYSGSSISSLKRTAVLINKEKEHRFSDFALFYNQTSYVEWNTLLKTLTIPTYSRLISSTGVYTKGLTSANNIVLDLSEIQHGYICYDTESGIFTAYPYTQTEGVPETSVLFASYAEYGKFVNMASSYKIDGYLFGIEVPTGDLVPDASITTAKLADKSVTTAKSTVAGRSAYIFNAYAYSNFNTEAKTLTIPQYSRVMCGKSVYTNTGTTTWTGAVIDLSSAQNGYVTFNPITQEWKAYSYDTTSITEDELIMFVYSNYGAVVSSQSAYTINGKLFGIDTESEIEIPDGSITTNKLVNGAVTQNKRTVAGSFAVLWNSYQYPEFNTTTKKFTIPAYSRILMGTKTFFKGLTDSAGVTLDLSEIQHGYICYDTESGIFTAYPYTQTEGVPETSVLFASYAEYGKFVNMASSYKIDGYLFGIEVPTGDLVPDASITTAKLADKSVTTAKSTVAGRSAYIFNAYAYSNFNTEAKTLTIPQYSRVMCGKSVYTNTGTTTWTGAVIDLSSAQNGYVTFNPITQEWKAYSYDTTSITEDELIMFVYSNYGAVVSSQSAYTINGKLFGIDTESEIEIPDGSITTNKLAPKLLQTQLSRCPSYTFTDLSAIGIQGWSDICIIGNNLWMFFPSTGEDHTTTDGTIKIVNKETLETVKTIYHDFGHVNTCDYCKETDCLIVGNLPGNSTYPAALYIFYNISSWMSLDTLNFSSVEKTIVDMRGAFPEAVAAACSWGESNFAYHNIAYVSFNYDKQFTKIVLGMGENHLDNGTYIAADTNKFNGTYNILQTSNFEPMGSGDEVIQGATFYKGQMLTANGDEWTARASLWQFDINGNIQRELLEFPIYNANGRKNSQYKTYTEGIAVDEETGYIYQGIFSGQLYAIRFYLIKYKI